MTMTKAIMEREERRRKQKEIADRLKASGAMDEIFAKIDAGEALTGEQGLLGGMIKAALERGLDAELTEHVGYDRGDAEASLHAEFPQWHRRRRRWAPRSAISSWRSLGIAMARSRRCWSRRGSAGSMGWMG